MRLPPLLMRPFILNILSILRNISYTLRRIFLLQFRGRVKMVDSNVNLSNHLHRDECWNIQTQFWICYFPCFSVKFSFYLCREWTHYFTIQSIFISKYMFYRQNIAESFFFFKSWVLQYYPSKNLWLLTERRILTEKFRWVYNLAII